MSEEYPGNNKGLSVPEAVHSEDDLRLLLCGVSDFAIIFTNPDRNIVRWDRGAEHVLGWTEEEAVGTDEHDLLYTPEDVAAGIPGQEQDTALREGRAEVDRWRLKKDGTRVWTSGVLTPLYDRTTGALRGFGRFLRDQTLQKCLEEELRFSEAQLTSIFTQAAVGLSEISLNGRFLRVNGEICRILGRSREELLSSDVLGVTHAQDAPLSLDALKRAIENGGPISLEKRYVRPDGIPVWANSTLNMLRDERGAGRAVLAVTVDLTESKLLEEELKQSWQALKQANETLEIRVAERTQELEAALTERQDLLRRVVTTEEQERRRISRELHDQTGQHLAAFAFRLAAVEEIIQGLPVYTVAARAAAIREVEHLRRVSKDLGEDLHRVAVELRPTALDDLGLVAALRSHVERWSESSGVAADFDYFPVESSHSGQPARPRDGRLPELIETTVFRVVQEALTNAAKYAGPHAVPGREARVSVTLQRFAGYLLTSVEDNGPGFDVGTAKRSGRLGLAGMDERATACGGTFFVESTRGEGTTIYLRIPIEAEVSP